MRQGLGHTPTTMTIYVLLLKCHMDLDDIQSVI